MLKKEILWFPQEIDQLKLEPTTTPKGELQIIVLALHFMICRM